MIPRSELELSSRLPADASYWMPSEEEIDFENGEGIGFFRDVWLLMNVPHEEALEVAAAEREICRILDEVSPDSETFEELARLIEFYDPEDVESAEIPAGALERLEPFLDEISPLGGLEVGVSGLSHALASVGCVPVASCRSHTGRRSWSDRPVVIAAIDRPHAMWLQPTVRRAGCGFAIDWERPDFLIIEA